MAVAKLRARGLPDGVGWSDLLHEALARALDGSRQWPSGVPLLVFLAGVMRSIGNEIWRRRRREAGLIALANGAEYQNIACPAPNQERVLAAGEAVAAIYRLFCGDQTAQQIISGLASGLSAEDIRRQHDLSSLAYDSARRRIRRTLLRAGLAHTSP
jgi:RNA polymerase sigma-70 factor (ECF subfamily)